MSTVWPVILTYQVLGVVFGYAIGRTKHRPVLGALLGCFLGFIGLFIIAVLRTDQNRAALP